MNKEFYTLEEVMAEAEESERRHAAKPWVVRKAIEFAWWVRRTVKYPPRPHRTIQWRWQRAQRGYSDRDLWGFHYYLAAVIVDGVKQLREISHGYPGHGDADTYEKWLAILEKIEDGFRAHLALDLADYRDIEKVNELKAKEKEGMALFITWYSALWD